ncbi:hypothetical protein CLNEO_04540 [Anaerotignum neopropionicum]|uniref:Uncharacterized protein n=1 Tax=Anaerotignum neopropionicum TaxID=36847 RepID=A0A136WIF8_9FIRM|nr:hypothetical protein [Anaerotignum neopropionicum]KXL54223.1 hypothetical protein CLNEO_03250 [Anaerotignum neopropionicum]KXL54348.1 hypothetical protein CLNEO_04540 [Anaerotignum neopropionicum]
MKEKKAMKIAVVCIIGLWMLSKIPFNQNIKQEVSANIYQNGGVTGKTTVVIDGEKSNYLFRDDEGFYGKFYILSYEKTGRENMVAGIRWRNGENVQQLMYSQNGTFPSMDIISTILTNDKITQFAVMLTDGTVIATSDEIYQLYTKYISYDSDTRITHIERVNEIPKIE